MEHLLGRLQNLVGAVIYQKRRRDLYLRQVVRRRPHGGKNSLPLSPGAGRAAARPDVFLAARRRRNAEAAGGQAAVLAGVHLHPLDSVVSVDEVQDASGGSKAVEMAAGSTLLAPGRAVCDLRQVRNKIIHPDQDKQTGRHASSGRV